MGIFLLAKPVAFPDRGEGLDDWPWIGAFVLIQVFQVDIVATLITALRTLALLLVLPTEAHLVER